MILFMHGLNSSNQTNKYTTITQEKYCETVDYLELGVDGISKTYDELIDRIKPDVLVGHSLGGYWALKKGAERNIPCVLLNPSLFPMTEGYTDITTNELAKAPMIHAYIELGDEIINGYSIAQFLSTKAALRLDQAGHHRIERLYMVNEIINQHYAYELVH
jgi:hypothetical protein